MPTGYKLHIGVQSLQTLCSWDAALTKTRSAFLCQKAYAANFLANGSMAAWLHMTKHSTGCTIESSLSSSCCHARAQRLSHGRTKQISLGACRAYEDDALLLPLVVVDCAHPHCTQAPLPKQQPDLLHLHADKQARDHISRFCTAQRYTGDQGRRQNREQRAESRAVANRGSSVRQQAVPSACGRAHDGAAQFLGFWALGARAARLLAVGGDDAQVVGSHAVAGLLQQPHHQVHQRCRLHRIVECRRLAIAHLPASKTSVSWYIKVRYETQQKGASLPSRLSLVSTYTLVEE